MFPAPYVWNQNSQSEFFSFKQKSFQINSLSSIQIELILGLLSYMFYCFPGCSDDKEHAYNAGHLGLIPGLGRSPGEGNSYPLQYSGLGNPMDREAWQATVSPWGHKELDMIYMYHI